MESSLSALSTARIELVKVLLAEADKAQIPIHYGKKLVKVEEPDNAVKVTFADGSTDQADVLLGCDGIDSAVRREHVDPGQAPEYSGMSGIGSIICRPKGLPQTMASQLKGINGTLTTPGAVSVISCTPDGEELQRAEEVAAFQNKTLQLFEGARSQWADLLRVLVAETQSVQVYLIYKPPPGRIWHRDRCVLIGDAAHAMQRHAGQGVSQAVEDVFLLSKLLQDPRRSPQDVFDTYERMRRRGVEEIAKQAARNSNMRKRTSEWGLWLKEWDIWGLFCRFEGVWVQDEWGGRATYAIDKEVI
ncbi:hypothetical protein E4U43_008696 [Claviceps pusilla]|uniref:FAD-binding domain-containing protein n=1 Tax=Claviceps pusilla TaxID=123648 RepID=A0A9P7NCS3_9HYPO|nr:hypothetical protein E4U43_008696 [Claviceps pusilla]